MSCALVRTCLALSVTVALHARADEATVKKMVADYAAAFNNQDIESVTAFWAVDSLHIDRETGVRTEGRENIIADIRDFFESTPDAKLQGRVDAVRFIRPDVASVEGLVTVTASDADLSQTEFSAILVNGGETWMMERIEERPLPVPSTAYDALRDLEWLVGTWSDESNSMRIDNVFRWTDNGAFLIRSFGMESADGGSQTGTQVIGWDPRSQEIRSWSFNSDGSFGDAVWSKNGEDWLIKSSQTLSDGQAASGTFILSRDGDDSLTLRLIGHDIEGEPQPAGSSVTVVRVEAESVDGSTSNASDVSDADASSN